MPHKVNFKSVTSGKDPLARFSKRKGNSARDSSSEVTADELRDKYEDLQGVRDVLLEFKSDLSLQYDMDTTALKASLEESKQRDEYVVPLTDREEEEENDGGDANQSDDVLGEDEDQS
ncbi:hypothetical protein LIER_41305 [Lithospermum erythrorhizon]|uniref:Uncharacterized protein n=1 Tax=Lithospermum erythrorhizon TaxID=34254 RepID=A0AAV3R8P1_LITER